MTAIDNLHNRIDLSNIPFTDRGSRLLLFLRENTLSIRLAERWAKWERQVGHYRQRPPMIEQFALSDADGAPLELTPDTYPHAAGLETRLGRFEWVFVDPETLLLRLPSGRFNMHFIVHAEQGRTDRRGGTLHGKRHVAYTTNAVLESNQLSNL
jgi:hypothetical protein